MGAIIDATGEYYRRTTSLPSATTYSWCAWFNFSQLNEFQYLFERGTFYEILLIINADSKLWFQSTDLGFGTLSTGTWYHVGLTKSGDTYTAYLNGTASSGVTDSTTPGTDAMQFGNGADGPFGHPVRATLSALKVWDGVALSGAEMLQEMRQYLPARFANLYGFYPLLSAADDEVDFSGNGKTLTQGGTLTFASGPPIPWKGDRQRRVVASAAAGAYTITAEAGSFSITGTAATLKAARTIAALSGSYTVTGTAATLKQGRVVAAAAGSVAITGTAAGLRATRQITAAAGSVTVTGTAASLEVGRKVSAAAGAYTITGTDATLTYQPNTGEYTLTADPGSVTVTGTAAALNAARTVAASAGAYSITGTVATLKVGRVVTATAGSVSIAGTAAGLRAARMVAAGVGSFAISGTSAALVWSGETATISRVVLRGSYQPTVPLTGSYQPSVDGLTGSVD